MTSTGTAPTASTARDALPAIVDSDVHPTIHDVRRLRSHMSARAARRAFGSELQVYARDPNRIPHPTSGLRLDARPPRGGAPGSDPAYCAEQLLDPFNISVAILIAIQSGTVIPWGDEAVGVEFIAALNDYLLEEWCRQDDRYRLALNVSPYDMRAAVDEVTRRLDEQSVCAIFLPHGGVGMGRTAFDPLYEIADANGLPIVLHPTGAEGNLTASPRLAGGLPYTYPERHSLLLQPGQAALASMIFGGVFERHPGLRLVLSEYGISWLAPMLFKLEAAYEHGDRTLAGLSRSPSQIVRESVRFTSQPLDEPPRLAELWEMLEIVDAEHTLMFSSDYPHWDNDNPAQILGARLPEHLRERIAYRNAVEFFGPRLGLDL